MTATATELPFEDTHEFDGGHYYMAPNEEVRAWCDLLVREGVSVHKAAGICSGGEVGFFALLPHVQRELVLIDHSYRSLSLALVKYLMVQNLGFKEAQKVLASKDPKAIMFAFEQFKSNLPEKLQTAFDRVKKDGEGRYSYGDWSKWNHDTVCNRLATMWTQPNAAHSVRKMGKVKFMHGDLTDLEVKGPFGLLYLSNALDGNHRSRTGQAAIADAVAKAGRKGTYIVECGSYYLTYDDRENGQRPKSWKLLDHSQGRSMWQYKLWVIT